MCGYHTMKIGITFPCGECEEPINAFIGVEDSSMRVTGPCGHFNAGDFDLTFTRGPRILIRARWELEEQQDYSMAIVLSALAFEAELSRLHHKWEGITALNQVTDEALDEILRRFGNISDKIEHISRLMYRTGLDDFVQRNDELCKTIANGFPSLALGDLARSFQHKLFWPRNRVLHLGYAGFQRDDAARCFSIAALGLRILQQLDEERRKAM